MGAKARKAALARLHPESGGPPLLVVATGPYIGKALVLPGIRLGLLIISCFVGRSVIYVH
jgi:hypothetical protein